MGCCHGYLDPGTSPGAVGIAGVKAETSPLNGVSVFVWEIWPVSNVECRERWNFAQKLDLGPGLEETEVVLLQLRTV